MKLFVILSCITLLISGCGLTYKVLLGVDTTPEWNTDKQILKQAKKYKIPIEYSLVLDTSAYLKGLKTIYKNAFKNLEIVNNDSSNYHNLKIALHDDQQPTQFRLYDQSGMEIFKLVNCYVDPPIPMNWNVEKCFNTFPPKISFDALNVHMFGLDFLLTHSKMVEQNIMTMSDLPKTDYYGVIFWNEFFKRPSRRLIKTVRTYIEGSDKHIVLIYINDQNQQLWSAMSSASKQKVKDNYNTK